MSGSFEKLGRNAPRPSRPIFLATSLILGLGTIIWLTARPDPSRKELARMRAELRAKGEALSRNELLTPSPRWDLIQPFTNAVHRLDNLQVSPRLNVMSYTSNGVALPSWAMEKPAWRDNSDRAPSLTWEQLAYAMKEARPILEQIRTIPTDPIAIHGLGHYSPAMHLITLSQWFNAATIVALHQGDCASALENLEAGLALAHIGGNEPSYICQIGRSAVITITTRAAWETLQYPGLTEAELRRLQAAWESVAPLTAAELALKGELAFGSDYDETARHVSRDEPVQKRIAWPFYLMKDAPADQLFCLSYRWDALQVARALGRLEPWIVCKPQAQAIQTRFLKMANSKSGHWIPRLTLPKIYEILESSARNETVRQLLLADIAIQRFKLRHNGAAPKNLTELSSDFLKAPSRDPMTGKQLLYCASPDGSYLLYSTGEDGRDDGGNATPIAPNPPGLWNAKDVVWPRVPHPPKSP